MSKQVIVRLDGGGVYENLEEAARDLGGTASNVSRAISESGKYHGVPLRWASRVYAVKEKASGRWRVCVMNGRNTGYVPVSQVEPSVRRENVDQVKDLTAVWYL